MRQSSPLLPDPVRRFFGQLGPGLITGAADDDPSGISTYSVTGASFGYTALWTALFSFPLMVALQLMCARLGLVTGRGLAGVVRVRYPRWVLWGSCSLLIIANVFNIGADLAGMAAATELVSGVPSRYVTPLYALLIVSLLFWSSYASIVRVFKWLTLVLFGYVAAAFLARPDWSAVWRGTFVPQIEWSSGFLATLVGLLGTTISPYLFFWQAAEEVEELRASERQGHPHPDGPSDEELRAARTDVAAGMFVSNTVMFFIILTTAATLHANGLSNITSAREAAEALRPLAGEGAYLLFTLGLVGTGMLGVPVLAGSCAYAVAEAARFEGSLEDRPGLAPRFYAVIGAAMVIGLALDLLHVNAVRMLFWSAILNGLLAPPLIVLVTLLTRDPRVMGRHVSSRGLAALGWITAIVMTAAGVGMFATLGS